MIPNDPAGAAFGRSIQALIGARETAIRYLEKKAGLPYADAEDLVQAALADLLGAWRRNGVPSDLDDPTRYLAHAAMHIHFRQAKRDRKLRFRDRLEDSPAGRAADPAVVLADEEELSRIWMCAAELEYDERLAFISWHCGYGARDTARILGCSEVHARVLKFNAVKRIKGKLGRADSA